MNSPQNEHVLIDVQKWYSFSSAIASIFLNVYLFKIGGFYSITIFNLANFVLLYIVYYLTGFILQKWASRDIIRVGLFVMASLYAILFLLGVHAKDYVALLGMLNGIGQGLYWAGLNLSMYLITHEKTRSLYFGKSSFATSITGSIAPLIGGGVIFLVTFIASERAGYFVLFLLLSCSLIYTMFRSETLPKHSGIRFASRHIFRGSRPKEWKFALLQQVALGLWDSSFAAFSPVILYLVMSQEFTLGVVNTVSAFAYAFASIWAGSILYKNRDRYVAGIVGVPLGLLLFATQRNILGIAAYIFLVRGLWPFLNIPLSKSYLDVLDDFREPWQEKYHYFLEREFILGAGRIASFLFLTFYFTPQDQIGVVDRWLIVLAIFPILVGLFQFIIYRERDKAKKQPPSTTPQPASV